MDFRNVKIATWTPGDGPKMSFIALQSGRRVWNRAEESLFSELLKYGYSPRQIKDLRELQQRDCQALESKLRKKKTKVLKSSYSCAVRELDLQWLRAELEDCLRLSKENQAPTERKTPDNSICPQWQAESYYIESQAETMLNGFAYWYTHSMEHFIYVVMCCEDNYNCTRQQALATLLHQIDAKLADYPRKQ